jgi:chromate transporter
VLAIIAGAVLKLAKKAIKNWQLGILGVATLSAVFLGLNEILALLATGIVGGLFFYLKSKNKEELKALIPLILLQVPGASIKSITSMHVFWSFLKVGAVLYGSGYVLFAYLDAELVSQGWMTRQQLMDAIAIGQFTPGPVLSTATFIGYQLSGFWGALAATVGIFLPSFLFVWLLNPLVPKMRKSLLLKHFLDAVNVAAVAVMLAVLVVMSIDTLYEWRAIVIAILSFIVAFGFKKVNAMYTVIGGSILGYLLYLI